MCYDGDMEILQTSMPMLNVSYNVLPCYFLIDTKIVHGQKRQKLKDIYDRLIYGNNVRSVVKNYIT